MLETANNFQVPVNFEDYLVEHEQNIHADKLQHISEFIPDALDRLRNGATTYGSCLPWTKTENKFRLRPSELTIWAGSNGSGKSQVTGQIALALSLTEKIGVASFEMPAAATTARLIRQATGGPSPGDEVLKRFCERSNAFIYNHVGTMNTNTTYGMCHYMIKERGIKHIFIDSMVKCGVSSEKNEPQKQFVSKLQDICKEHGVHIHLIHHLRKPQHEKYSPSKGDIKGAGEITDLADNVVLVYRNEQKSKKIKSKQSYDPNEPDCFLDVCKQRHFEFEGVFAFWWHEKSGQWIDNSNGLAHRYIT